FFSSRRRHTRSKRDWSSDVCSSDLVFSSAGHISVPADEKTALHHQREMAAEPVLVPGRGSDNTASSGWKPRQPSHPVLGISRSQIGRASCRERVSRWVVDGRWKKEE